MIYNEFVVSLIDEDWNQLTDWAPVESDDHHGTAKWDKPKAFGTVVGYLMRHLPSNMVAYAQVDVPIIFRGNENYINLDIHPRPGYVHSSIHTGTNTN